MSMEEWLFFASAMARCGCSHQWVSPGINLLMGLATQGSSLMSTQYQPAFPLLRNPKGDD